MFFSGEEKIIHKGRPMFRSSAAGIGLTMKARKQNIDVSLVMTKSKPKRAINADNLNYGENLAS